jgi:hypothetical protein
MEYRDEEYYSFTCTSCHRILFDGGGEKPEDHVIATGHGEFIVTPYLKRKYNDYLKMSNNK